MSCSLGNRWDKRAQGIPDSGAARQSARGGGHLFFSEALFPYPGEVVASGTLCFKTPTVVGQSLWERVKGKKANSVLLHEFSKQHRKREMYQHT